MEILRINFKVEKDYQEIPCKGAFFSKENNCWMVSISSINERLKFLCENSTCIFTSGMKRVNKDGSLKWENDIKAIPEIDLNGCDNYY